MSDILAARSQMAMSLVFHIIFAAIGVALPLMMVIAEALWLRTQDATYLCVAKRWAKGTAILFAIGTVSGTFECSVTTWAENYAVCLTYLLPGRLAGRGDFLRGVR
jgi:cytochrome bd-type quinol oxidase subunit 1